MHDHKILTTLLPSNMYLFTRSYTTRMDGRINKRHEIHITSNIMVDKTRKIENEL